LLPFFGDTIAAGNTQILRNLKLKEYTQGIVYCKTAFLLEIIKTNALYKVYKVTPKFSAGDQIIPKPVVRNLG